ncbi:DUF4435 domain-containing protein [Klebsiella aerogenes]
MNGFGGAFTNPDYIQGLTQFQSQQLQGIMYVESPADVGFWNYLLQRIHPRKFKVLPASQKKSNGKRTLEAGYTELNSMSIVGVDADMDYLCPNRNQFSSILNSSPFVMHTFCYSMESLQCSIEAIEDFTIRLAYEQPIINEAIEAITTFSRMAYDAVVLHSFRHNENPQNHQDGLLWDALKLPGGTNLLKRNLQTNLDKMRIVSQSLEQFCVTYAVVDEERDIFERYRQNLVEKGVVPENAYQFIQGHVLHNNYVFPILKTIRDVMYGNAKRRIYSECSSDDRTAEKENRLRELDNFYNERVKLETIIGNTENYRDNFAYVKMENKIRTLQL